MFPDQSISTAVYLHKNGFSYSYLHACKERGWLDEIGHGAYCRQGHQPTLLAGLGAVCTQNGLHVHVGGRSALARRGFLHFIPAATPRASLYLPRGKRLPTWFSTRFKNEFSVTTLSTLDPQLGISQVTVNGHTFWESDPERAILELLDQVPSEITAGECFQILELMNTLRSKLLSSLLESCRSVKVKRLFLMLASECGSQWFARLNLTNVDLGSGCRVVDPGGEFNAQYNLVVRPWRNI